MKTLGMLLVLVTLAVTACAGPITWAFVGVTLNDGGTVTGSFTFNADSPVACTTGVSPCGTYSNVNIITTTGSARTGTTYSFVCGISDPACTGVSPDSTEVLFLTSSATNQTGLSALAVFFTGVGGVPPAGLTDAGGVIDISNSSLSVGAVQEANCLDAACSSPGPPSRASTAGFVATPEPSTVLLLGSALAGLGLVRLRARR